MSDRWGAFEDAAKLRERITVIETNLPLMRADIERQLRQLSEGQNANRAYTETKLNELAQLIKAAGAPEPTKQNDDRVFWAIVIVGVMVGLLSLGFIASVLWGA